MAKRFGDTDIWKKQRWFRKLSPEYKLAFLYIKDQCDHAGIWNIDCADLIEDLGIETFDLNDFIKKCNVEYDKKSGSITHKERIRLLDKGYAWITGFIQFQYKGKEGLVNPSAAPVKTALQILSGLKLLDDALDKGYITLIRGLAEGSITPKAKEKDKEKDKEEKGGVGEKEEVCYNIESYLQGNQKEFEAVCMASKISDPEYVKEVLRKFHLWMVAQGKYPQEPLRLIAGLTVWLLDPKNYKNGEYSKSTGKTIDFDKP